MRLLTITDRLAHEVGGLAFSPPVTHVYNPLVYARAPHEQYLIRYGGASGRVMLLGMNPGPWGMAQTGVPFGEVSLVREWLGIDEPVERPLVEHPKRLVQGFACGRSEVSGRRLWGWAQRRYRTPDRFFARFFVANYCPLVFMESSGRNRTPDRLTVAERQPLFAACDRALRAICTQLRPERVIGVGRFATERAAVALADSKIPVGRILHPSPASPAANRGWEAQAEAELVAQGITL